jgi:hypothetical protein
MQEQKILVYLQVTLYSKNLSGILENEIPAGVLSMRNVLHCVFCINLVMPGGYLSDTNQVSWEEMIFYFILIFFCCNA